MAPRRSYGRRRAGPRPKYHWFDRQNATLSTIAAGGQSLVDLFENISEADLRGGTVVRMLVHLLLRGNVNTILEWAFGILPITGDAFTAGAVPDPAFDEPNWYLYDSGMVGLTTETRSINKDYDIRTARRIADGESALLHVITNLAASASLDYDIATRILIRLP